ncbi:uncharacterized protein LOC129945075 [Eupeodes corollae]|uniref:uncharacterized protein LOC129945075 n=1 Tax=Eupeodes corollae TaxID=290404 RepID=UPI002493CB3F|nr:uncharacterized protein LOC129945075 [Eupeodes corollae]
MEHVIDTGDALPGKQRHYPVSTAVQVILYEELDRMLDLGVIEESESSWCSPVVLFRKPSVNRLCLDSRTVNSLTKKNANPLIPQEKQSREKTAFAVPGRPL